MASKPVAEFAARTAIGPFGSRMKSDLYTDSGVPVIRGTNLTGGKVLSGDWVYVSDKTADDLSNCCVYPGDLVFPHRGAIGEVGIVPDQFPRYVMSSSMMTLSCDRSKARPDYVYYFFKSAAGRHELLKNASQVGTPGIGQPLSTLRAIEVPLPPPSSQFVIAKTLGDLDSKIDLNRRINQTLEAMAQAIFKSWFVDFAPVKAKIAAKASRRDPLRAAMSVISGKADAELDTLPPEQYEQLAATAALFPDEMEASELGGIPKGWAVCPLPECVGINPARALKKGAVAPYLDMANVPTNAARVDNVITRAFGSGSKFINGDTLLARITPCLENGKTAYVDFLADGEVGWGSTEFIVLRPKVGLPLPFAYFLCRHPEFRAFAISQMAGTSGRQRVPNDCFGSYKVVKPSVLIAEAFGKQTTQFMRQIKSLDEESKTLAGLRDALLPRLLSGELQVPHAEAEAVA